MKVLFFSSFASNSNDACEQRYYIFKEGLNRLGIETGFVHIGDYFFRTPSLIRILNMPFYYKLTRGYDVIHGGDAAATFLLGPIKSSSNCRVVYDIVGNTVEEQRFLRRNILDIKGDYNLVQSEVLVHIATSLSDYFITPSDIAKRLYVNKGIAEERIEVLRNGVDTEIFRPANAPVENEIFTVTYAGSFGGWQGIENLLHAAKMLENVDVRFKIIGFGPNSLSFKQEIKRILKNKVELIDTIPRCKLIHHLNQSDVLVIPRYCPADYKSWDKLRNTFGWWPTKFAEYIATGRPVIVTTLDEPSDFVEKYDCGFTCNPTPEALKNSILRAKETPTQELLKKGINGRKLAEKEFDVKVIGEKYHKFLIRILTGS